MITQRVSNIFCLPCYLLFFPFFVILFLPSFVPSFVILFICLFLPPASIEVVSDQICTAVHCKYCKTGQKSCRQLLPFFLLQIFVWPKQFAFQLSNICRETAVRHCTAVAQGRFSTSSTGNSSTSTSSSSSSSSTSTSSSGNSSSSRRSCCTTSRPKGSFPWPSDTSSPAKSAMQNISYMDNCKNNFFENSNNSGKK